VDQKRVDDLEEKLEKTCEMVRLLQSLLANVLGQASEPWSVVDGRLGVQPGPVAAEPQNVEEEKKQEVPKAEEPSSPGRRASQTEPHDLCDPSFYPEMQRATATAAEAMDVDASPAQCVEAAAPSVAAQGPELPPGPAPKTGKEVLEEDGPEVFFNLYLKSLGQLHEKKMLIKEVMGEQLFGKLEAYIVLRFGTQPADKGRAKPSKSSGWHSSSWSNSGWKW